MTVFGEMPAEADRSLTEEEINSFKSSILWPAIEWLNHGYDFMREEPIGAEYIVTRTHVLAGQKYSVTLHAYIDEIHDSEGDVMANHVVECRTEFAEHNLYDAIVLTAAHSCVDIDDEYQEQMQLSTWRITKYIIQDGDDPVGVYSSYELRDESGDILWSDEEDMGYCIDEEHGQLTSHEIASIRSLQNSIECKINMEDIGYIRFVLDNLGVPESITYSE
ncbi:hypothetical protein H6801_03205 [Candidatus Nomurabacteria bacterium]|nr:hypothetical protein [Candidatus Saccharibacteria bacterium]MCA9312732.1 hypothetical protein [Candidatus Saccharibacteria bacterium]MCB9822345.1 hypothetical protein [Candidatus Nomurabacteria bacterium]